MKRSRDENKELVHNVRVNGRIYAAFRSYDPAVNAAYERAETSNAQTVEVSDQYGDILLRIKHNLSL